ncbi:S-layer homology domain-containing protein [Candidatus Peregrinibacteria bacterium]|nr:S-layer homology domain-containing protein [Candidatus Peregrinibacteria bacterium]
MTIAQSLRQVRSKVAGFSLAMLVMSMFTVGVAQAATFNDVPADHWAYPFVEKLAADGVLNTSTGTYRPADPANRAEMAKLVVEAFDLPLENPDVATFKDVPKMMADGSSNWAYTYIETAAKHAIVGGYKDETGMLTGYYGPSDPVTREQAMKMLVLGAPLTTNTKGGPHFTDVPASRWSYEMVETGYNWMVVDGYPGTTLFKPENNINRAEIAKMVANSMDPQQRPGSGFSLDMADATSSTMVDVCFTEEPTSTEAMDKTNYMVEDLDGNELSVTSVAAGTDPMCVELTTAAQDPTKVYELTVTGLTSADSGEVIMAGSVQFNGFTVGAAGDLTVRVDGSTPDSQDIPKNGANILFSVFAFEAGDNEDVRVEQLVLSREGLGLPGDFDNVKLYVDGVQKGGEKTVNTTTNTATFNLTSDPILVDAGTTALVEVRGDMTGAENSQNKFCINTTDDVTAYGETTDAELAVDGDFAACGEYMTTTSASVGTLTYKISQPSTAEVNVGDTDVIMTKLRLDAAQEDIMLDRVSFKQSGSADAEDFANPTLVLSGTPVDAEGVWEGDYLTFDLTELDTPIIIEKGASKNFELWVDVVGGLGNDASFDIYRDWHIEGTGQVYHYGVNVEEDVTSITPADRNIVGGNIAFALSSENPISGEVADGANDHEFLRFNVSTAGDAITIRKLTLTVSGFAGGVATEIEDLKIWSKNSQGDLIIVAGPNDVNALGDIAFLDTFDVPGASTTEFVVTADIITGAVNNHQFRVDVADVTSSAKTEIEYSDDGDPVDEATEVSGGVVQGNVQEVQDPSVQVDRAATPGDKSYVKNNVDKDLVAFDFAASTADDIKLTTLTVTCTSALDCSDAFQSLKLFLKDGSTLTELDGPRSMTDLGAGDGEVVFSFNQDVPAGNSVRLLVRGNVASAAAAGPYMFDIKTGDVTAEDSESNDATVNGLDTADRTVTVAGNGTLGNQNVSDTSVRSRILVGTTTLQPVLKLRFSADELEAWYVRSLQIYDVGTSNDSDVSKVYLQYADSPSTTYTASANMISSMADFQLASGHYIYVPANGSTTVTVLVDVGDVTTGGALAGELPQFQFDDTWDFSAVGVSSATEDTSATTVLGEEQRVARSAPTVAKVTAGVSSDLANGDQTLYKWTVKADAADDIAIKQFAFSTNVSSGTLADFKLLRNGVDVSSSSTTIDINADSWGLGGVVGSIEPTSGNTTTGSDVVFVQWLDASDAGEEIIPAGATVTYELKATVAGTVNGDTVSTSLLTDSDANAGDLYFNGTYIDVDCDTEGACATDSNFVWSDLSVSPHDNTVSGPSSIDWLDGYLVEGLSSAGSQTLS